MKAVVISSFGDPEVLKTEERPVPAVGDHEVLIRVKAAGINRPDVFQRKGNYPAPAGVVADIPGLEISGVIEATGSMAGSWKTGDEVLALIAGGGYAEYAVVDAGSCMLKPQNLSYEEAAAIPETVFTVWHNLFERGQLKKGERVLIHGGSGGIGSTAIQLAALSGAQVYATAGNKEKCEFCESLGAVRAINYHEEDFEEVLKESGVDVILDCIGGDYFNKNIAILNPDGRLVYINAMEGAKVQLNILQMMQKRLSVTGSTLRARDKDFKAELTRSVVRHVFPFIESKAFKPMLFKSFDFTQAEQAHRLMEEGHFLGKLVLTF